MKKIIFTSLLLLPFVFNSCQTSSADPEEVLTEFFSALYNKNFSAAAKLVTEESKDILVLLEYGTKTNPEELDIFNPDKMEMGKAKINGNTAIVTVKENSTSHNLIYTLQKENNKWRVAFNNFPQLEEEPSAAERIDMDAPIDEVMDKLEEVNFDSIKNSVKEDLKKREKHY